MLWQINLVDQLDAIPVQFGFSASPIIAGGRLYVSAGGSKAGLICMDPKDGNILWNHGFGEASYATPLVTTIQETRQIIVMNRETIDGIEAETGELLWQYSLPKSGLTNVPTPILTDNGLVVSGQGIGGTVQLTLQKSSSGWSAKEGWFSDFQFFYCNWVLHNETVIGCDGDLLMAFDIKTGKRLGRWRGFAGANVCCRGDQLLVLHGDGRFSSVQIEPTGLVVQTQHMVWDKRVWTPPTLVDDQLFSRCGSLVSRVDLTTGHMGEEIKSNRIARSQLAFSSSRPESTSAIEPVERIVSALETQGPDAAWKIYGQLRSAKRLTIEDHHELVQLAIDNGMTNEARRLAADAQQDYPMSETLSVIGKMIRDLDRKPRPEISRGKNGLDYVEFAIVNGSEDTLQTYVKGPEEHPFSYGIPLRPGKTRIEKWPVGTKLYHHPDKPRGEVLLKVSRSDAGKTIEVTANQDKQ
ncbi:MAG: PQQ-binding-like beta-propeller repeat protein [Planctomycetota bacterium]